MKKLALFMASAIIATAITGCNQNNASSDARSETASDTTTASESTTTETSATSRIELVTSKADESDDPILGGNEGGMNESVVTGGGADENASEVFKKVAGDKYELVALLGIQNVAGVNYAFLVKDNNKGALSLIKVYSDTEGKAEITGSYNFDYRELLYGDADNSNGDVGGWEIADTEMPAEGNDERAMTAFKKVADNIDGVILKPVALLGSQLVAGMNYVFLCTSAPVTPDAVRTLKIIKIYADLDDNAKITEENGVNLTRFS